MIGRTLMFFMLPLLAAAEEPPELTRQQAEQIALANNPHVKVSQLLARLQGEVVRETRAAELPSIRGSFSAVEAEQGSRFAAGSLTASLLLDHVGAGVEVNQLVSDFGRTRDLAASQRLREKARQADTEATAQDIILAADQAFYQLLEAQSTLAVAEQTVQSRQTVADRVAALAKAKLKSALDLSFSQVNLSQARLLQVNALGSLDSAKASLAEVLGTDKITPYRLKDDASLPALPVHPESLIEQALQNRPDLRSLELSAQASKKFATAQRKQLLPAITAVGVAGYIPAGSESYFSGSTYGAAGLNIAVPIFDGFRFRAQAAQANAQTNVDLEHVRDLRNRIARDVRIAWNVADAARQRLNVSVELLAQARSALSLAQTRYDLGLSSIAELSQAQLQETQAAIGDADARSEFGLAYAEMQYQTGTLAQEK